MAFKYNRDMTLFVKVYRTEGGRVKCCVESVSCCYSHNFDDEDEEDSSSAKAEESSSS